MSKSMVYTLKVVSEMPLDAKALLDAVGAVAGVGSVECTDFKVAREKAAK